MVRGVLAAFAVSALAGTAAAQGTQVDFGALRHESGQPIEVTSEELSVDQTGGTALFSGDVLAVQGEMRLGAETVRVIYGQGARGGSRIERLEAEGSVVLVLNDEAAEAERAVYDVAEGVLRMTGKVVLTQGPGTIAGERLEVDLDSGTGRMAGRVRTVLRPGEPAE